MAMWPISYDPRWRLLGVGAVLYATACAQTGAGGKRVIDVLHQTTVEEPKPVAFKQSAIHAGSAAALPPVTQPQPGYPAAYGNSELNSRLPGRLPSGPWSVRWQAPLNAASPPNHVVEAGNRVLTEGGGFWRLFSSSGSPVAQGNYNGSHVVLDAAHSLFYFADKDNFLAAYNFDKGARVFMTALSLGGQFIRPFIARSNNRFVIVGVEMGGPAPARPDRSRQSLVEHIDVGAKLETDSTGLLFSIDATGRLLVKSDKVAAAVHNDTIAFAVPNAVLLTSTDMKPKAALTGDFNPVTLSLDESGRIYLLADKGAGRVLMILTPEGVLCGEYALKTPREDLIAPPIIGPDHRVYLVSSAHVTALDSSAKTLWDATISSQIAGAAVTADGRLLVSAGPEVLAFDAAGHRTVVHSFAGESLATPPVVTANQDLLVASKTRLYCLKPAGK